jgi:glucosamine-6-phosphate deaminase
MEVIISQDAKSASDKAARYIADVITRKPDCVLGLATGSTPLHLYNRLVQMHKNDGLDFSKVTTFNLDEYLGLKPEDPQSYHYFMFENLFSKINIDPRNVNIPDGMTDNVMTFCNYYERKIRESGGIDLQILGIGTDGHIGFNEPTSSFASRTRIKTLTRETIQSNARFFGNDESKVPQHVITMGIGTVMDAANILMLAFGKDKANAVAASIEGPVSAFTPASVLQMHRHVKFLIDEPAAASLKLSDYYKWVYDRKPEWNRWL